MIEDKLNDPIRKLSVLSTVWEENSARQMTQFLQQINGVEEEKKWGNVMGTVIDLRDVSPSVCGYWLEQIKCKNDILRSWENWVLGDIKELLSFTLVSVLWEFLSPYLRNTYINILLMD